MKTVWKFEIPKMVGGITAAIGRFEITMPEGAVPLSVGVQNGVTPVLWALVDDKAPARPRRFALVGTGQPTPDTDTGMFVGTYQIGWFVGHVFMERAQG